MQTVETLNEGLKRAYTLTIAAKDIAKRVDAEIARVAPQVKMPGFRPGKVPPNLVRKMHGEAIEADALNTTIQESVQSLVAKEKLRPAMSPAVELGEGYAPGKDAEIKVALEILPDIAKVDIDGLKLERLVVEADDDAVKAALTRLATQQKGYQDAPKAHKAATGDLVMMDFLGKVDGEPFEGGKGENVAIEIGSGRLIPGFEDQLIGVKANDETTISVTFPADYSVDYLKSKAATFDLVINEIRVPKEAVADEEFAKSLGLEGLDQLRSLLKGQIEQEHGQLTRTHMKRRLLDALAERHEFDVPPTMVDAEFDQIWAQLEHEAGHEDDPEAARKEMETDREDYRRIALRRVRLGLLLSEIGQKNNVEISQAEMSRLIAQAAQQYKPEERERFAQYVAQDPMAAAQIRAPLYEDKVVDFLFSKAEIVDRPVSREELEAAIEAEVDEGHVHGPGCGHDHAEAKPKGKKPAAKKKEAAPAAKAEPAAKAAKPVAKKEAAPAKADKAAHPAKTEKPAAVAKAPAKKPAAKKAK